jgi:quinol monooxygenase YgiN
MSDTRCAGPLKGDASSTVLPKLNLESTMIKHALFVRLEAKPGKEKEVAQFLQAGVGMAQQEGGTPVWFALQLGPSTFGVFDAFHDEAGRQAHLNGAIAQALGANAPKLLAQAPSIERIDVLGAKLPG